MKLHAGRRHYLSITSKEALEIRCPRRNTCSKTPIHIDKYSGIDLIIICKKFGKHKTICIEVMIYYHDLNHD